MHYAACKLHVGLQELYISETMLLYSCALKERLMKVFIVLKLSFKGGGVTSPRKVINNHIVCTCNCCIVCIYISLYVNNVLYYEIPYFMI